MNTINKEVHVIAYVYSFMIIFGIGIISQASPLFMRFVVYTGMIGFITIYLCDIIQGIKILFKGNGNDRQNTLKNP